MKLSTRLRLLWHAPEREAELRRVIKEAHDVLRTNFGGFCLVNTSLPKLAEAAALYFEEMRKTEPIRRRIVHQRLELRKLNHLLETERRAAQNAYERGYKKGQDDLAASVLA